VDQKTRGNGKHHRNNTFLVLNGWFGIHWKEFLRNVTPQKARKTFAEKKQSSKTKTRLNGQKNY